MPGKVGRPKKDKYAELAPEFKDSVQGKTDEQLNDILAKVAKDEELNRRNKDLDEQLKEAILAAKEAGLQYRDASKTNKLKTSYIYDTLKARGKV